MRSSIREFAKLCAQTLELQEPIYEFGSLQVPKQEGFADLRPFFKGKQYVGADVQEGPGVDVVLDLHKINLPDNSVGTILTFDTFEHVEFPRVAIEEIYRVLKQDGVVVILSVMNWPIHNFPHDYWRYTPEAFKSLLKPFASTFVGFSGYREFPETIIGIGWKRAIAHGKREAFEKRFLTWKRKWSYSLPFVFQKKGGWRKYLIPFIPPLLMHFYRVLKKSV